MLTWAEIIEIEAAKENQRRIREYLKSFAITPEQACDRLGLTAIASLEGSIIPHDHPALSNFWDELLNANNVVLEKARLNPLTDRPAKDQRKDVRTMRPLLAKAGIALTRTGKQANSKRYYLVQLKD